ncbi:hypothetical protein [Luteimonas sp. e5]
MNVPRIGGLAAALLCSTMLAGCGENYAHLEESYAVADIAGSPSLHDLSIKIGGPAHKAETGYADAANVYLGEDSISINLAIPRHQPLRIPVSDISGCAMSCTQPREREVDFLIGSKGTYLSLPSSNRLIDWCWEQKKPIYSGEIQREWRKGAELPAPESMDTALSNKLGYRSAMSGSCRRR